MKKRYFGVVTVIVIIAVVFLLLSREKNMVEEKTEKEDKIQIGMSFDSFVIERWIRDRDVFVSTAKSLGAEVNVQNANGSIEEQKKHIDYFIKKGVDAIVVVSVDSYDLREYVKKAQEAGIKVIAYDRLIADANVDLYITFDNAMVGSMMADTLLENGVAGGKVLMLGGSLTDSNVPVLENAFREKIVKNDVVILGSMHAEGWKAELAADYVYEHVDMVAKVDAIMCGNDNVASQVVPALAEKRLAGHILVVGQDADLEACQRIVEGTQLMTVYKPVEKLAKRAAECTVQLIMDGEVTGEDVSEFNDGTNIVPYVGLSPISVTKENIDEAIIDSGFHLREDVYLNIPSKLSDK